jgi:Mg2+ and Co2+ transporter CorA
MSEIINDSNDEVLAVEETVETPAETIEEAVVEAPEEATAPVEEVVEVKQKKQKASQEAAPKEDVVAIFSTKNISWAEIGSLKTGYNLVPAETAEQWLTANIRGIRKATPDEVAARSAR